MDDQFNFNDINNIASLCGFQRHTKKHVCSDGQVLYDDEIRNHTQIINGVEVILSDKELAMYRR